MTHQYQWHAPCIQLTTDHRMLSMHAAGSCSVELQADVIPECRRLANREAARRMRSRRQQQAVSLGEEASQLRNANQQLLERLQLVTQQHQDALQQINLLRSELMTVKQTLVPTPPWHVWQNHVVCLSSRLHGSCRAQRLDSAAVMARHGAVRKWVPLLHLLFCI